MIKLFQYAPCMGLPNASPFCLKLETYLKMAELPYEVVTIANPGKAPKAKLPYIMDNGRTIADSTLIIDYLKQTYGDKLDAHLSKLDYAHGVAFQRLLEEHFYWCLIQMRWIDPEGWQHTVREYFAFMPKLLQKFVPGMIRKNLIKATKAHGMGRHSPEEIHHFAIVDLNALATQLGSKPYLFGDKPTSFDACAYAFLINVLYTPYNAKIKQALQQHQNLVDYAERIHQAYYP